VLPHQLPLAKPVRPCHNTQDTQDLSRITGYLNQIMTGKKNRDFSTSGTPIYTENETVVQIQRHLEQFKNAPNICITSKVRVLSRLSDYCTNHDDIARSLRLSIKQTAAELNLSMQELEKEIASHLKAVHFQNISASSVCMIL